MTRQTRIGAERYLAERAAEPGFTEEYEAARRRIDQIDRLVHALDERREALAMTKAELARRASIAPEAVRRLFSAESPNPDDRHPNRTRRQPGLRAGAAQAERGLTAYSSTVRLRSNSALIRSTRRESFGLAADHFGFDYPSMATIDEPPRSSAPRSRTQNRRWFMPPPCTRTS